MSSAGRGVKIFHQAGAIVGLHPATPDTEPSGTGSACATEVGVMAEFDQYKETYEAQIGRATKFSGKNHDFFVRAKATYFIDVLKKKMETGIDIRLLDIGCGHGLIHPLLEASGLPLQITGIDVAAGVIDLARRANPRVRYDVYEGEALPYRVWFV